MLTYLKCIRRKKMLNKILLTSLSATLLLNAQMVFDPVKKTFVDKDSIIKKEIVNSDSMNDKILKFENIKINEHKVYELKELEPEPINIREIQSFKELEIIDVSGEIDVKPDDYNISDGDLYTSLFFNNKEHLTHESKQKLNKILNALNGVENFDIIIESNYYSLENEEFNYSKSIINGQNLKEKLLLETYALENNIKVIPFGSQNKLCVQDIDKCKNANTRIELFIKIKDRT